MPFHEHLCWNSTWSILTDKLGTDGCVYDQLISIGKSRMIQNILDTKTCRSFAYECNNFCRKQVLFSQDLYECLAVLFLEILEEAIM